MGKALNLWSFIFSLFCVSLFFMVSFTPLHKMFSSSTGINPLDVILYLTLVALLIGVMGFQGIHNWKSVLRSVLTVILSVGLLIILVYIIFIGKLFGGV